MPPHTTKRRTTNLKRKITRTARKIKLYGSSTTKELKKKHSFRPVGRVEMGSWGREDQADKAVAGRVGGPTFECR